MTTEPRKTPGLINFQRQLDAAFPNRRRPDGWIADDAHTGVSSHHPDDTPGSLPEWDGDADRISDVRAVDVWSDLGLGVSPTGVCMHLANLPNLSTVVRYIIHNGLIWDADHHFVPRKFHGDPHPDHIHVTFAFTEAADRNTTYDYRFEAIHVPLTPTDIDAIWRADIDTSTTGSYTARGALFDAVRRAGRVANDELPALAARVDAIDAKIDQVLALLSAPPST